MILPASHLEQLNGNKNLNDIIPYNVRGYMFLNLLSVPLLNILILLYFISNFNLFVVVQERVGFNGCFNDFIP